MIDTYTAIDEDYRLSAFEHTGATRTGFSDTFRSYSVLGVLVFVGIGVFMGWLFGMAVYGRLWAQFYYVLLVNDGLMAFTESTDRFFSTIPYLVAATIFFVWPRKQNRLGKRFARRKHRPFRPVNTRRVAGQA